MGEQGAWPRFWHLSRLREAFNPRNALIAILACCSSFAAFSASRHAVDGGALFVDIEGQVPDGYRPSWDFVIRAQEIPLTLEGSDRLFRGQLQFAGAEGRSTVLFRVNGVGELCQANLVTDSASVLLSARPTTFRLSDFRAKDGAGPCQENSRRSRDWSGQVTLSAAPSGDLSLDLMLATEERRGKVLRFIATSIPMKNRVPPSGVSAASAGLAPPGVSATSAMPQAATGIPGEYSIDGG
jgi:hypothetical protein